MEELLKHNLADFVAATTSLPDDAVELRRFLREKLRADGSMRYGGHGYPVTMEDLSEQGCQFRLPRRGGLPKGAAISLYIEKIGPFSATVRWARDGWIGVEFDIPVYPPVLRYIHDHLDRPNETAR